MLKPKSDESDSDFVVLSNLISWDKASYSIRENTDYRDVFGFIKIFN